MSLPALAAVLYAIACLGVIGFQIALIAGAPWGRLTQGGAHDGPLPLSGRIAAGVSILIIAAQALALLSLVGFWPHWPAWTAWVAVIVQTVSCGLNWITPSPRERALWGPVTSTMLALALVVLIFA
ncbi:hypothetical protein [Pseudaestuariivita atlantica]|uniref:Uncharacterized protein n=1 Tax=Pseudaestuariivita atlantica TaxID=1317121 RepID=A0A0L1JS77_9RHOB|nr:hypothetical protein [Pseudaestuariivita atlantica]KNG94258.1 hypothetical protein ATO11_08585 [Pseudaestuariivita atlantica]